jgi:ABC-2 type transport system ATP-binding protein
MSIHLEINHVSLKYPDGKLALDDINLNLRQGLVGLLGSNGAGKSSLMRILAGISQASSGNVSWQGHDIGKNPNALRQTLGYLPQSFGVYDNLSAIEFLGYLASLKKLSGKLARQRIDYLLETLNLSEVAHRPLHSYSGGMRQRVGIAQALLNDPKLLIMDEPSSGLDPQERAGLRDLLSELSADRIIILSTHIVSDIESIADHIALLNNGVLVDYAKPEDLLQRLQHSVWLCSVSSAQACELRKHYCISHSVRQAEGLQLRIVSMGQPCAQAINAVPTLEDAFLYFSKGEQHCATLGKVA